MNGPAIALRGVSKSYRGRRAVDGVDLEVAAGTILVLLGPSGAGKSTLLRLVAGLEAPDEGTIEVHGRTVADPRERVPAEQRGVGMVFQSLELWPHMTVAENVAFGLPGRPRREAAERHARVLEVAASVGLPTDLLRRRPATLSGGERQRVAIARALAPKPHALLYDEPLANLDPSRRAEIRRLVRALRASTATSVLYVTHDAAEALEVGDEVVVLEEGRVVERGTPAALYARPRTIEGARALGPVTALPARRRVGAGGAPAYETPLGVLPAEGSPVDAGHLLLRPEHVVAAASGAAAQVVDAYSVAGGFAFAARLGSDGPVVLGRSPSRLVPGEAVRLAVVGTAVVVGETSDEGRRSA